MTSGSSTWRLTGTSVLYGREAYPDLDLKAAVLMDSIVGSHPLVDGNKRLGWLAAVVFYGPTGSTSIHPMTRPTNSWSQSRAEASSPRRSPGDSPFGNEQL